MYSKYIDFFVILDKLGKLLSKFFIVNNQN